MRGIVAGKSGEADFATAGGGGVDGVEDLLDLEGFFEGDEGFFIIEDAVDEVLESVFGQRDFEAGELDGFVAAGAVAIEFGGEEGKAALGAEEVHAVLASVLGLMAGPTDFEIDGAAAFHFDDGGGAVFDVAGFAGINFAFAPVEFAEAARAEFGVGLAEDAGGFEVAQEMEGNVEDVDADIEAATAAGIFFLREPRADARDAAAPQPKCARVIDVAEVAALDEELGHLGGAVEAQILTDHEGALHFHGGVNDPGCLFGAGGHGLFEEDMFAGLEGFDGDRRVKIIGQGDGDGINVRLFEQLAIVGIAAGDFETLGGFPGAAGMDFRHRDDRGSRALGEPIQVVQADSASSDHRAPKSLSHKLSGVEL